MTIYDDGIKQEEVELPRKSIPEMHALMVKKGFVQKVVVAKDVVPKKETNVSKIDHNNFEAVYKIQGKAETTIEEAVNGRKKHSKKLKRLRVNEEEGPPSKSQMWKNYILAVPMVLGAYIFILRVRSRRRSQRHTV